MKRRLLTALLIAISALDAGAQRVALEVPLSPSPTFRGPAGGSLVNAPVPAALAFGLMGSPSLTPHLSQPVPLGAIPLSPLRASPVAGAPLPALPLTAIPSMPAAPASPAQPQAPKVIDSLRLHGAKARDLAGLTGESGANALEKNFMAAASLGDGASTPAGGDGAPDALPADAPLMERLLQRVRLDDRGRPDERQALEDAFKRMLGTPTGRRYAEEFLAEGLSAHVHFEDFPDSQLFLVDGRKRFYAAQAYTDWRQEGYAEVRLNRHYVDGDPDNLRESLPSVLGHELLGHGLWYGRAAKENLYNAFHYHELNETLARLVGWAIDHEQDGALEEQSAWNYLADPSRYVADLRMRHPYYATTFGQEAMADPVGALNARLELARAALERTRLNFASQKTWLPVLDHFSRDHGIPAKRFDMLRKELGDLETYYENEVVNAQAVVKEVSELIGRIIAEPDHASENYLRQAAAHPFFERLSAETARLGAVLQTMTSATPRAPPRPAPLRPADQISWQELADMYQQDVAADARRAVKHWH